MRLTPQGIANIRRGLKRSWQDGSHRARQQRGEIDSDTLRRRALDDRRGSFYAKITKRNESLPGGVTHTFTLLWSVTGRTDQIDIVDEDGRIIETVRPSLALERIDLIMLA